MSRFLHIFLLLMALVGCAESRTARVGREGAELYFRGQYARSIDTLAPVAQEKDENYVLNNLRLGSSALAICDTNEAERAFINAYDVLNSTNVNDGGRAFAAATFSESVRVWRGEPFERAMANFYLGAIYYARQDYGNARGAFENSLFKLRIYDEGAEDDSKFDEQESDFAVAMMMLGRSWMKLGRPDQAESYFRRVETLRPDLRETVALLRDPRINVILFVEFGYAPRKTADGMDGAQVAFVPTPDRAGRIPEPLVYVNGQRYATPDLAPPCDTVLMAQDRRWQSIDTIRTTKSVVGTGLLVGGALVTANGINQDSSGTALAGLGMMAVGALLKASSEADTRHWEMAPRTVFVVPLALTAGQHEITVDFPQAGGLRQTWQGLVAPPSGQDAAYFFRMSRQRTGPYTWPPVLEQLTPLPRRVVKQ
jgi:tetratricopeptide (TPR) repeat protein